MVQGLNNITCGTHSIYKWYAAAAMNQLKSKLQLHCMKENLEESLNCEYRQIEYNSSKINTLKDNNKQQQ